MFRNMLTSYANSVSRHTGVHYVPSFNDLNSQCQDDLEEVDALSAASRQTLSSSSASERGRGGSGGGGAGGDDLSSYRYKGPVGQPPAPEPSMVERNRMEGRMSNKENDSVPGFDPNPDIYKISVPRPEHRADWVYDRPRGNKTSIWQYIAKGQEDPMGKTSSPDSIYTHTSA